MPSSPRTSPEGTGRPPRARLLVVHHSPTRTTRALLDAVLAGTGDPLVQSVEVVVRPALEAVAADVLEADGYLLGTPANFGYMSGALKHFFDSTFQAVGGHLDELEDAPAPSTRGRPFGLWVHGRYDTTGAVSAVTSIVGGLGWAQVAEVLAVTGPLSDAERESAYELGATLAATVADRSGTGA
jgi:NAD(P)H-dependent FMN reductase